MDPIEHSKPPFRAPHRAEGPARAPKRESLATPAPAPGNAPADASALDESERLRAELAEIQAQADRLVLSGETAAAASSALNAVGALIAEASVRAEANLDASLDADERDANQSEIDETLDTIDALASGASLDDRLLLDGSTVLDAGDTQFVIERVGSAELGLAEIDGRSLSIADIRSGGALDTRGEAAPLAAESLARAREHVAWMRRSVIAFAGRAVAPRAESLAISMANVAAAGGAPADVADARDWASGVRDGLLASGDSGSARADPAARAGILRLLA